MLIKEYVIVKMIRWK